MRKIGWNRETTMQLPSTVSNPKRGKPKISAGGILIRDGSNTEMRRVPDFG